MGIALRIILSRTDSIGDVVLTLPMAGVIKKHYPDAEIFFLGRAYTKDIIESCEFIDHFIDWTDLQAKPEFEKIDALKACKAGVIIHVFPRREMVILAHKAGIPRRIGATGRWHNWLHCNLLVPLSRKHSLLHEAQLNLKLLRPLKIKSDDTLTQIIPYFGFNKILALDPRMMTILSPVHFNLVLHPLSLGSAREWGLDNFKELASILTEDKFRIFITGSKEEGHEIRSSGIFSQRHITDLTGRLSLAELISFINAADGLIAASTGPLHIAAALGKLVIGLYPPIRPMHPGRWAPIGEKAHFIVREKDCNQCRKKGPCHCMQEITPAEVAQCLMKLI